MLHQTNKCNHVIIKTSRPNQSNSNFQYTFIPATFNYCPLVWKCNAAREMLTGKISDGRHFNKFVYNDEFYESCHETLLVSSKYNIMCVDRMQNQLMPFSMFTYVSYVQVMLMICLR